MAPALPPLPDLALMEQQVRETNSAIRASHAHVARVHADVARNMNRLREEMFQPNRAPPPNLPTKSDRLAILPRPVKQRKRITYRWSPSKLLAASLGGLLFVSAVALSI